MMQLPMMRMEVTVMMILSDDIHDMMINFPSLIMFQELTTNMLS